MASGGSALNVALGDSVTDVWWSAVKEWRLILRDLQYRNGIFT